MNKTITLTLTLEFEFIATNLNIQITYFHSSMFTALKFNIVSIAIIES